MKTEHGFNTTETTIFFSNLSDAEIRSAVEKKARAFPDHLLIEKTPDNARKLGRILEVFPEAKIIHVIRNPPANINSLIQTEFSNGFRFAKDLLDAIRVYREVFNAALPFENHPALLRIRYEDLHSAPSEILRKIAAFCGLELLSTEQIQQAIEENHQKTKTIQKNIFRLGQVDSYCSELTPSEITEINSLLSKEIRHYHYD